MRILGIVGLAAVSCGLSGQITPGDSAGGEKFLATRGCAKCHNPDSRKASGAPDLGRRLARDYSPTQVAAAVWNHAPAALLLTEPGGTANRADAPGQASALLAYFTSRRYFERPGDAARGKQVFAAKRCSECHGLTTPRHPGAPPVAAWRSLGDRLALAADFWNRHNNMSRAFASRGFRCPTLTGQELTDLLQYLERLPALPTRQPRFQLGSAELGRGLFQAKGCSGCHSARPTFNGLSRVTMTDLDAAMWNHSNQQRITGGSLSDREVRDLGAYLWLYGSAGSAKRGEKLFAAKNCVVCHAGPRGMADSRKLPAVPAAEPIPVLMTGLAVSHGPSMMARMKANGRSWPRLTSRQLADLGAFLQTVPRDERFYRSDAASREPSHAGPVGFEKLSQAQDVR